MIGSVGRLAAAALAAVLCLAPAPIEAAPKDGRPVGQGRATIAHPGAWAEADPDADGDIRVVVIQREGAAAERAARRLERRGLGRPRRSFDRLGGDVIKVSPDRLPEVLAELEADPDVEVVEPDRRDQRIQAQETPWGVDRIGASPETRMATGLGDGAGVKVAVLDTGIWHPPSGGSVHPDLAAAYKGGYDFVNDDPDPWDDNGHGTHVAGVIAAADNAAGVVGVAPGVSLYALKVLDGGGGGSYADLIAALDWSVQRGIRIVNYSGGGGPSLALEKACERARAAGVTIVAAAGNGAGELLYPAAYPSVVAVGATDRSDLLWVGSNTGAELDFVAPGEGVRSTFSGGGYAELSGTSIAAPHVAGVAALVAGRTMVTEPGMLEEYLRATAVDLGVPGRDPEFGYGRVDVSRPLPATPPTVLAPQPGEVVPSGVPVVVSWTPVPGAVSYRVLFARSASRPWSLAGETLEPITEVPWRPPVVGRPLATGRLQVAAYDAAGAVLSVDTRVGFVVKAVHLADPAPGAWFRGGDPLHLAWDVYRTPRKVARIAVERSLNGGRTWRRIRRFRGTERSFDWVVPRVSSSRQLRLRVVLFDRRGRRIAADAVTIDVVPPAVTATGTL